MPFNNYQNRHTSSSRGNTYVQNNPQLANNSQPRPDGSQPPAPATLERPRDCINRHSTPPFSLICKLMEKLRDEEAGKRRETLDRFFKLWRDKVGPDLYPLIRLLLPERDRERAVYGLKEMTLAKCYVSVLGLDPKSPAAQRLVHWKQPVHVAGQVGDATSGDFAKVCYQAIKARSTVNEGKLSVEAVNSLLDDLCSRRHGKLADYLPTFSKIYSKMTPNEQEWLIRIILKDLRISVREKGVLAAFHPNASELFNVCSDLKRVCWTLHDPSTRLGETQTSITLFNAFLPMLCHRQASASLEVIAKAVGGGKDFIIEEKLDGERMQVHMRNGGSEWFYCSRKAKDYGYLYGTHVGEGTLTPHIAGAFKDNVRNCILDGEMLVWDPLMEKYLAFGGLKTAALDKSNDADAPRPCFKVFDILYLNDTCLMSKRLSERKRLLHEHLVFDIVKGRLELPYEGYGKTGKDIQAALEKILEEKGEGLVVKNVDSFYETNARVAAWTKVKPEYADEMGENLDVLVLGGWFGSGGRGGKISSLLCGLRVEDEDDGLTERPTFQTVCKVGSGMNIEDYQWIQKKHGHHFHQFDRKRPPSWMITGPSGLDDKPDVYIHPEDSFVIEVKASEIVPAALNYGCGYTLRFPRCKYIRWDAASRDPTKPIEDNYKQWDMWNSLSLADFMFMLRKEKKYSNDGSAHTRKKKKVTTRSKVNVQAARKGQTISSEATDHLFDGKMFYILKDCPEGTKSQLEKLVHDHGGDFTQAQLADNSAIVIAPDSKGPRTSAQIRRGNDVIKASWIKACINKGAILPYYKEFVVNASEETSKSKAYERTLADYDPEALVRERTGGKRKRGTTPSLSPLPMEEDEQAIPPSRSPSPEPELTAVQAAEVDAWGLRKDAPTGDRDSSPNEEDSNGAESDPDSEVEQREDSEDVVADDDERGSQPVDVDSSPEDQQPRMEMPEAVKMGDKTGGHAYDEEKIFSHLCFYIDTAENAERNGLQTTYSSQRVADRLNKAQETLRAQGGKIATSIDEPELTHIIMDNVDSGRYSELVTKTSKPKYKHIVVTDWVIDSLDNGTLQTEDMYKPS